MRQAETTQGVTSEGEEDLWLSPGWLWYSEVRSQQRRLRAAQEAGKQTRVRTMEEGGESSPKEGGHPSQTPQGPPSLPKPHIPICAPQSTLLSSFAISPPDLNPPGWIQIGNASFRTYSSEDGNLSDFSFASVFLPQLMPLSVVSF